MPTADADPPSSQRARTALGLGAAAAGTYAGLSLANKWYQRTLPPPTSLPPALDWNTHTLESPHGRTHCYVRPGTGPPIVLLHSLNAAASSYEMKPLSEHLAATTDRPLWAVDWLGFGRSDRPAIEYAPPIYSTQLYQLLTDVLDAPADLIALSLGCEYAAGTALQAAPRIRRLVLISPTGLTAPRGLSIPNRLGLSLATRTGLFALLFYRFTRRESLRRYYERLVFRENSAFPDDLVEYAWASAHVRGAHHAPRRFLDGSLFVEDVATEVYGRLYRPTLMLTPNTPGPTVQSFDLLPAVLDQNPRDLTHQTLPGGLMPHWERASLTFEAVSDFLEAP